MPEEQTATVETQPTETKQESTSTGFNPFSEQSWSAQPTQPTEQNQTIAQTETSAPPPPAAPTTQQQEEEEEIVEPSVWLEREFGIKDPEEIKREREEYKKLKDQKPPEPEFSNEQSKQIYELIRQGKTKEVMDWFGKQDRLNTLVTNNVSDENAEDIIKLGMQLSNELLTKDEIDFQYRQQFALPKEPVQRVSESEDEYTERLEEWKEKVANVKMAKVVAAKMAIPQLEKQKANVVLPEIQKPEPKQEQPSQEYLDKLDSVRKNFLQKLESDYSKVDGFSTTVKDESVELPISFKIPDESKVAIKGMLESGFDVNNYIDKRWFDESGNPKINQIIEDIYELENRDKVHAGIANNAAAKRLEAYIKASKNIDLGKTPQQTFQPQQNQQIVNPYSDGAWSDKPIVQN